MCHVHATYFGSSTACEHLMRAGRLLNLLLLLHNGGRMTTRELARRLEVSPRTVLRDLEALGRAGVPVYAVRGPQGGFELLDTFDHDIPLMRSRSGEGRTGRVRVRISPSALQMAQLLGRPRGWRPRPHPDDPHPDRPTWIEGSFRVDSSDTAVHDLLPLGADVEVLLPRHLRDLMADIGRRIARLHESPPGPSTPRTVDSGRPSPGRR